MDERKVILADGTEIPGCGAGMADGQLWIYPGMTMKEAAGLFLEEEKTAVILYERDGETKRFEGFTECILMNAVDGGVRIQMVRPA